MRILLWVTVAVSGLWFGYWWVGSGAVERATNDWFTQTAATGLVARNESIHVAGFPNRFDLTINGLELRDPSSGIGWKAPFVQVFAMTWKPWHLIAALPHTQVITANNQSVTLESTKLMGSIKVHPNSLFGLDAINIEAFDVALASDAGWTLGIEKAFFATVEDTTRANTHRIGLSITNIRPDPAVQKALTQTNLPDVATGLHLDAFAALSAPLDKAAAETQPQLLQLDIADATATWGDLHIAAKGMLKAGDDGLAVGEVAIKIDGWRLLPKVLAAIGLVKPEVAPTIERAMQVIAAQTGDLTVLNVVLKCADGWMSLGPLPLGPAPRFNAGPALQG